MGLGTRIFLVNDDDSLEHLSVAKFERLRRGDPKERLCQYAGKRVRYALVLLEVEQRRPVEINHIQYAFLHFDSEGRLDVSQRERKARAAVAIFFSVDQENRHPTVIDARHKFAKRRYASEYRWSPTPEIETKIAEVIFGR